MEIEVAVAKVLQGQDSQEPEQVSGEVSGALKGRYSCTHCYKAPHTVESLRNLTRAWGRGQSSLSGHSRISSLLQCDFLCPCVFFVLCAHAFKRPLLLKKKIEDSNCTDLCSAVCRKSVGFCGLVLS